MDAKLLGANIRKYRKEKGLTQDQAAELCGLSPNYFRQIELGNKIPRMETFVTIAESLNASTDRLLAGNLSWTPSIESSILQEKIPHLSLSQQAFINSVLDSIVDNIQNL